jgi:hypothetical protein
MLVDQKYIKKKNSSNWLLGGNPIFFHVCIYICVCVIVCVLQLTIHPSKILGASHWQRQEDHTDESQ